MVVNDCLQKQVNQSILAALNIACSDQPTAGKAVDSVFVQPWDSCGCVRTRQN